MVIRETVSSDPGSLVGTWAAAVDARNASASRKRMRLKIGAEGDGDCGMTRSALSAPDPVKKPPKPLDILVNRLAGLNRCADAHDTVDPIERHRHDRYPRALGDVPEPGFPALDRLAGSFGRDGEDQ